MIDKAERQRRSNNPKITIKKKTTAKQMEHKK